MALQDFTGTVAVITGGASGIGLATAHALSSKGAHVVLADINDEGLQQAQRQIRENNPDSPGQILTVVTDVTSEPQVQALMSQAFTIAERIDLVVTSAGVGRGSPIDVFSAAQMQTLMNVNFMGTYHCVQAALPIMRQQQSGHFAFLSSIAGKLGVPLLTAYCATKWAVRGFASALRAELYGTGIGVTTVYPSWVDTPMIHQEVGAEQLFNIETLLTPEQVANEIVRAVQENQPDLTLAPDQGVALLLEITKGDPNKAEQLAGEAFQQRMRTLLGNTSE